jgi:hypothetical protein
MIKRSFIVGLLLLTFSLANSQQTLREQFARKISQKMKDSLNLSEEQEKKVYTINMQLHDKKREARDKYKNPVELGPQLQRIENTRDGLYETVLNKKQYILYKQKKRNLINNN